MTREDAIDVLKKTIAYESDFAEAKRMAIEALSAMCDDCIWHVCNYNKVDWDVLSAEAVQGASLINRHDAITVIRDECWKCNKTINDDLFMRIMSLPTSRQTDCTEFIMWLVEVVLDDEDWELNAVAYGEVIARKLKKLGLLEVKDGYYIRHIENNATPSDLVYRPSAKVVHKPDYSYEADMVRRLKEALSDETHDKRTETHGVCSDRIGRQDAIDAVNSLTYPSSLMDVKRKLIELPSADRPTGEWVHDDSDNSIECNKCGCVLWANDIMRGEAHYCPNCGAKMGGNNHD